MYFQERSFASQQLPLDLSPERLYNASGFWSKLRHIGTLDRQSAKFVPNSETQLAELDLNHEVLCSVVHAVFVWALCLYPASDDRVFDISPWPAGYQHVFQRVVSVRVAPTHADCQETVAR